MDPCGIAGLSRACSQLMRAWILHACWFAAMCAAAWRYRDGIGLKVTVLLALLTVPPVLYHAARVHRLSRAVDPCARTIGLVPMLVMAVLFTPFEAGLIVPAKNLWEAKRILRGRSRTS